MEAPEGSSSQGSNVITTLLVNEDEQTQPGPVLFTLDQGGLDSIFLKKIKELFFFFFLISFFFLNLLHCLSFSFFLLSCFCSCCALSLAPLLLMCVHQKEDCPPVPALGHH